MYYYGLDPAHYFSSPGMPWDAVLKMTKAELELITNIVIHNFFKKGKLGGISMVSKRNAKTNNPLCPDYDSSKPTTYITYEDANNLYGNAMSQPLPVGQFHMGYVSNCGQKVMFEFNVPDDCLASSPPLQTEPSLPMQSPKTCEKTIRINEILNTPDDVNMGYVVEVDIKYLEHLRDAHSDYPLAPEAMAIPKTWLNDYQLGLENKLGGKYAESIKFS